MTHYNLGDLIKWLRTQPMDMVVKDGFGTPHSDRGDYANLAFDPENTTTIKDMLLNAESAVGSVYTGWKGGDYKMYLNTPVFIGECGECGIPITDEHIKSWEGFLMLNKEEVSELQKFILQVTSDACLITTDENADSYRRKVVPKAIDVVNKILDY